MVAEEKELNETETKIIHLVALGYDDKEIADKLCIAYSTAKFYMAQIFKKFNLTGRSRSRIKAVNVWYKKYKNIDIEAFVIKSFKQL